MSEIEQLRKDIATMEAAQNLIADGDGNGSWLLHDNIVERKKQLAKLESEAAAKADPWANEKQVIKTLLKWSKATHGNAAARYARHLECQVDNISYVAEVLRRDFESARNRIAELESELARLKEAHETVGQAYDSKREDNKDHRRTVKELEAELAKRPVVYCLRNKATGKYNQFTIHAGIALYDRNDFATFDQWEFEPYTGKQS